jgi:hypothetical protein
MISCSSVFASSHPATSAKVSFGVPVRSFAFDLPNANARFRPPAGAGGRTRAEHHDPGQQVDEHGAEASLGLARVIGTPASSTRFMNRSLFAIGEYGEALRAPAILRHGTLEVALDTLAVEYFDTRDVAPLEFMAELAIGKLRRRAPLAAHHLEER